jgi:hypothetical protein
MICSECFTREHITRQREILGGGDPLLIEKSIHALALLGHLADTGLPFLFKGGTSLLLHLPRINRLSIDVDILCASDDADVGAAVFHVSRLAPFTRHEENDRGARGLPARRHFKFFYTSVVSGREEYVLLDVVKEDHGKLAWIHKPIATEFIKVEREVRVRIPTVEALLGDKLTAFAPHTLGVPFHNARGHSMSMQVVKQLFDVGVLFNHIKSLAEVKRAYAESYSMESIYRQNRFSMEDVLRDTQNVALQVVLQGVKGGNTDDAIMGPMTDGIKRLGSHLVREPFRLHLEAKIAAAKAYLLAGCMGGSVLPTEAQCVFDPALHMEFIRATKITDPLCLNRLKATVPEAFYFLALRLGVSS